MISLKNFIKKLKKLLTSVLHNSIKIVEHISPILLIYYHYPEISNPERCIRQNATIKSLVNIAKSLQNFYGIYNMLKDICDQVGFITEIQSIGLT